MNSEEPQKTDQQPRMIGTGNANATGSSATIKQHLAKNALPAPYTRFIAHSLLESLGTRDSQKVQDNGGPAPRTVAAGQTRLTEENG